MEKKKLDSQINIKLIILDIFPSLEEVTKNNSETINIYFQDNNTLNNLSELLLTKKELNLIFPPNSSNIKITLYKNDNLYASGLFILKNNEQWVTFSYENKKRHNNSNLALNLIDCLKLKIICKIISGNESINYQENNINNLNNMIKKAKTKLNQKKITLPRKLNVNQITQQSFNTEENLKSNRIFETEYKSTTPNPYTTVNKNNIKKIELTGIKSNKLNNRKITEFNYTNLMNEELKNLSLAIPSTTKNSFKVRGKKSEELGEGDDEPNLITDIKSKTKYKHHKRSYEDINNKMILNTKKNIKNNRSIGGIRIENSNSKKNIQKRKSGGLEQININSHFNGVNNRKENKRKKKEKSMLIKKKSKDNLNNLIHSEEKKIIKSSRIKNNELDNLPKSTDLFNNNEKLLSLMDEFNNINNKSENKIDNQEIVINHDIENIEDYNLNNNSNLHIFDENLNNDLIYLDGEQLNEDIFSKQLEDFKLLYTDEYIKSINNDYIKLEIELFIEKILELTSLYNNQIEEKNFEYKISKNNYLKNILKFIEIQKLSDKLRMLKTQYNLKRDNLKEITSSYFNNSINNLYTNKQEIKIFKLNFIDEIQKKINKNKEALKQIIKKLLEKEKNKGILEKNERYQIWIKNNIKKKDDKKKKDKNLKIHKQNSKKVLVINNKKITNSQIKSGKNKLNKTNNEDKGKSKSKNKIKNK